MEDKDFSDAQTLSQERSPQRKSIKVSHDNQIQSLPVNESNQHLGDPSADVLRHSEEAKVIWENQEIETSTEPHSTSNLEDELNTYSDAFSSGESELEDYLYHFNNFFTNRFDKEMSQFQANLQSILYEQQNHVRRIVRAVTDECTTQRCTDSSSIQIDEVMNRQDVDGLDQEPMMINVNTQKDNYSTSGDGDLTKGQSLLQLMTMACSVSSILAKPQFRI